MVAVLAIITAVVVYKALTFATAYVCLFGVPSAYKRHKILMKAKEELQ